MKNQNDHSRRRAKNKSCNFIRAGNTKQNYRKNNDNKKSRNQKTCDKNFLKGVKNQLIKDNKI